MSFVTVRPGDAPLIISLPHAGTEIPDDIAENIHPRSTAVVDTDWWVDRLYDFASDLGATSVQTRLSRAVVDVDRNPSVDPPPSGWTATSLCPLTTFDGVPFYRAGKEPGPADVAARVQAYFDPYHAALSAEVERLRRVHPHVVVYDAHSIRSLVPRLFEGTLPVLNVGTNGGLSCAQALQDVVVKDCAGSGFAWTLNERFKGGWIVRRCAAPENGVHCVQMGIAQRGYMEENGTPFPAPYSPDAAAPMRLFLESLLTRLIAWAESRTVRTT